MYPFQHIATGTSQQPRHVEAVCTRFGVPSTNPEDMIAAYDLFGARFSDALQVATSGGEGLVGFSGNSKVMGTKRIVNTAPVAQAKKFDWNAALENGLSIVRNVSDGLNPEEDPKEPFTFMGLDVTSLVMLGAAAALIGFMILRKK